MARFAAHLECSQIVGCLFQGCLLDHPLFGPAQTIGITLYWERDGAVLNSSGMIDNAGWHLIWVGRGAYQIGSVTNLAPNGGFERTLDLSEARLFGWPAQGYIGKRVGDPSLILDKREELPTVVLYLDNSFRETSAFLSEPIEVCSDLVYLLAAWRHG